LIARNAAARVLKNEPLVIGREVCLGVLATERQLPRIAQVALLARDQQQSTHLVTACNGPRYKQSAHKGQQQGRSCNANLHVAPLPALFQRYGGIHRLSVAQHLHVHHVTDFSAPQPCINIAVTIVIQ
jgi:hypothetical protein